MPEPVPAATPAAPLHVRIVGRVSAVLDVLKSAATVMVFLSPVFWWAWSSVEAKAEEYVKDIIAPALAEQNVQIQDLKASIDKLVSGQRTETVQSRTEAGNTELILCLLQKLNGEAVGGCETP